MHQNLGMMSHCFAVHHVLLSLFCASPWVSLKVLFWWASCRPSGNGHSFHVLHIFSQRLGISFAYVPCHSTDIYSWWCFRNCSYSWSVLMNLCTLSCQILYFPVCCLELLFISVCQVEHLFTHKVTGLFHCG